MGAGVNREPSNDVGAMLLVTERAKGEIWYVVSEEGVACGTALGSFAEARSAA